MTKILEAIAVGLEVLVAVQQVLTGGSGSVLVHVEGHAYRVTVAQADKE